MGYVTQKKVALGQPLQELLGKLIIPDSLCSVPALLSDLLSSSILIVEALIKNFLIMALLLCRPAYYAGTLGIWGSFEFVCVLRISFRQATYCLSLLPTLGTNYLSTFTREQYADIARVHSIRVVSADHKDHVRDLLRVHVCNSDYGLFNRLYLCLASLKGTSSYSLDTRLINTSSNSNSTFGTPMGKRSDHSRTMDSSSTKALRSHTHLQLQWKVG
ncbi:hypothetical protein BDR07DRAFT_1493194 [Suillus spraguei]|nr:hypothetical protein BDR07DRAFT_1493194 [Suillus spraguei]